MTRYQPTHYQRRVIDAIIDAGINDDTVVMNISKRRELRYIVKARRRYWENRGHKYEKVNASSRMAVALRNRGILRCVPHGHVLTDIGIELIAEWERL